jgi:hypothetical protein
MIYRIAWWLGIAGGVAGTLSAYHAQWPEAIVFGLVAIICAGIVLSKPPE